MKYIDPYTIPPGISCCQSLSPGTCYLLLKGAVTIMVLPSLLCMLCIFTESLWHSVQQKSVALCATQYCAFFQLVPNADNDDS